MLAIILGARRGQRPGLVDFLPRHPKNFASSLAGQSHSICRRLKRPLTLPGPSVSYRGPWLLAS
jgi:hypothetical protein